MIRTLSAACFSVLFLCLAACSGAPQSGLPAISGASQAFAPAAHAVTPAQPSQAVRDATVTAIVDFGNGRGADFSRAFPHHALLAHARYAPDKPRAGKKVYVYAYLYPSYVAPTDAYWTGIVTAGKGGSLTIPFGKVTRAENSFFVVDTYAPTGAYGGIYEGSVGGIFNVGKGSTTLTATPATTLQLQGLMGLLDTGLITATDLKNPKLMKKVTAALKASGIAPDPLTGLYSVDSVQTFVNDVMPTWGRTMTIVGGSTATLISVANDTSDAPDMNARYNMRTYLNDSLGDMLPGGTPCYEGPPNRAVGKRPVLGPDSCAYLYGTGTGTVTIPVFGGPIVVGATNGVSPYTGATMLTAGGAFGAKTTVTLTQVPTQVSLTTNDPQDWAFGLAPEPPSTLTANGAIPNSISSTGVNNSPFGYYNHVQVTVPTGYSQVSPAILLNTWNPWGLSLSDFTMCEYFDFMCVPIPTTGTFQFVEPFADYGTSATYYNWTGTGGTTVAYNAGCHGYVITPSGSNITMTTTTPAYLTRGQTLYSSFNTCGGAGAPAPGTTVVVTATDAAGDVFSGSGNSNNYNIHMNTFLPLTPVTSITLTVTLGAGSPAQIFLKSL
ncbi:MAG: hypothetical protein JO192_07865 [Candidatus Eremiobacteraeota bacterium]|nr:hypothetical protein [Candidatus Eremiobacteraeota bacterium]